MTIPITPGKFSFLAELGRAGGAAFQSAEQDRQRKLVEAQQQAQNYLALRAAGLMNPKQFADPAIQALFHKAGYGPVSADPTPDEQLRGMKGDYLNAMSQPDTQLNIPIPSLGIGGPQSAQVNIPATSRFSDEQRMAIGMPTAGALAEEKNRAPKAALTGKQIAAETPEAGLTAVTEQRNTQDKQLNAIAYRVISKLYTQNRRLPTPSEAAREAAKDPSNAQYARLTEDFFGSAIEGLRQDLDKATTARIGAQSRAQGATNTDQKIYQDNIDNVQRQLAQLKPPEARDYMLADLANKNMQQKDKGRKVNPMFLAAKERVDAYNTQKARLERELQNNRDQQNRTISGNVNADNQNPQTASVANGQQAEWDGAASFIRANPEKYGGKSPEQVLGPRP